MLGVGEIAATLLVLTAAILYYWTGRRERRMLAKIPRPPGLPFFGVMLKLWVPYEDMFNLLYSWFRKFGPIIIAVAPGFKDILLADPDYIQVLLNSQTQLRKGKTYRFLWPWLGTGLLTSEGNKWRARRKLLNPAFHYNLIEGFVPAFNANSAILVAKLGEHLEDEYVELSDYIALCTVDNMCETMMGTSIHAQRGGEVEYIQAVKRMGELFTHRNLSPWLHNDLLYWLSPSGQEEKKVVQLLKNFTTNVITKKRLEKLNKESEIRQEDQECKKRLSLLDAVLEMTELTDEDVREEIDTFMLAGHDTTAAAICWTLFLLGAHQDIQDKVVAELSDVFGTDRRQPTTDDLRNMAYLDMVIKESLRLYPSVPNYTRCLESDLQLGEYTIPSGYNVFVTAGFVHRNPDIYPDPGKFDPERFSPEQSSARHPYAYIPFSAGPRNCIGQKFARLEMKSMLSAILMNYKLESLDYENVKVMPFLVLKSKDPLKFKISTRKW